MTTTPGNKRVGDEARQVVDAASDLAQRAVALLARPDALRERARHQLDDLKAEQVASRLRAMPLGAIKEAAGRGARIGALEQAGLRTVADVLLARPHQIHAVPGVGERTAEQVTQAARAAAAAVHREVRFRFDPDRRTSAQTALLATLAALRAADAAHAQLRDDLTRLLDLVAPLTTAAERTGSRWSMFFSRRATKDAALYALAQLDAILAAQSTQELMAELQCRERATDPGSYDPNELWREYGANAAAVNAVLSTVGEDRRPTTTEAAQGFVPEELRQRISAVPLDTSLLARRPRCAATRCSARSTRSTRSARSSATRWGSARRSRRSRRSPTSRRTGSGGSSWSARPACRSTG